MHPYWPIVDPILTSLRPRSIVYVGAQDTSHIRRFAREHDATLHAIDGTRGQQVLDSLPRLAGRRRRHPRRTRWRDGRARLAARPPGRTHPGGPGWLPPLHAERRRRGGRAGGHRAVPEHQLSRPRVRPGSRSRGPGGAVRTRPAGGRGASGERGPKRARLRARAGRPRWRRVSYGGRPGSARGLHRRARGCPLGAVRAAARHLVEPLLAADRAAATRGEGLPRRPRATPHAGRRAGGDSACQPRLGRAVDPRRAGAAGALVARARDRSAHGLAPRAAGPLPRDVPPGRPRGLHLLHSGGGAPQRVGGQPRRRQGARDAAGRGRRVARLRVGGARRPAADGSPALGGAGRELRGRRPRVPAGPRNRTPRARRPAHDGGVADADAPGPRAARPRAHGERSAISRPQGPGAHLLRRHARPRPAGRFPGARHRDGAVPVLSALAAVHRRRRAAATGRSWSCSRPTPLAMGASC